MAGPSGTSPTLSPSTVNTTVNSCAGVIDPKGGPALSTPPSWNRQRQLSGLWYDASKFTDAGAGEARDFLMQQTPPNLTQFGDMLWVQAQAPTWWTVDLWGIELARLLLAGDPAVPPANQSFLIANGRRFTRLKARVFWENMQVERSIDVDIGTGSRFSILANNVRVTLLIPSGSRFQEMGTVVNTVRDSNLTLSDGLLLDSMVGGSCYPCFSPLISERPTFTQLIAQLSLGEAGSVAPINVPVPPGAKFLSIYQNGDAALVPWQWITVGSAAAASAAFFPIPYDANGTVERRPVPQNIDTIRMPIATGTRRNWQLVWELEL